MSRLLFRTNLIALLTIVSWQTLSAEETVTYSGLTYELDVATSSAKLIHVDPEVTIITIPSTILGPDGNTSFDVTSVLGTAFNDCTSLSDITIADSDKELAFGNNPLNYFYGIFGNCPLTQIYVGRNISGSSERLFAGQKHVSNLTLGGGLTILNNKLFQSCSGYKSLVIPSGVTQIGENTFGGSEALEDIKFSENLISIGYRAFNGCKSLKEIALPQNLQYLGAQAFWACSSLVVVKLPKSLVEINNGTFEECTSLSSIDLSEVQIIGEGAFYECTSLRTISLSQSLKSIRKSAFYGCSKLAELTLPNQLDSIGGNAFARCSSLQTISLPTSLKSLGYSAFYYCSSLEEISIDDSEEPLEMLYRPNPTCNLEDMFGFCPVKKVYIGRNLQYRNADGAGGFVVSPFYYNREIIEVAFGKKVTAIPDELFSSSESLKTVTLSTSIRHLGAGAFRGCGKLEEIIIPNSVISFGASVFSLCSALSHFEIPPSVTEIGKSAFAGCRNLQTITFVKYSDLLNKINGQYSPQSQSNSPTTITVLNDSVFTNCTNLRYIEIPNSVTSICDRAFMGCSDLDSIKIPDTVKSIGNEVFKACTGLKKIELPASVESIGERCFYECNELSSVILPANLNQLGRESFGKCDAISKIKYPTHELVTSTTDVFSYVTYDKAALTIPALIIPSVINVSPWNNFKNIQPIMAESLTILNVSNELRKGQTMQLSVMILPDEADPSVVWESTDPSVASISENGLVSALATGKTEISATAADGSGMSDKFTLTVTAPLRGDANDNGKVTITDAVLTADYIVGKPAIDFCFGAADTNGDGRITISDISRIIEIILSEIDD